MKTKIGAKMRKQKAVTAQNSSGFSTKQASSKNSIEDDLHPLKQPRQQQEMGIQMLKMLQEMEKSKKLFRERILKHRLQKAAEGTNGSQKHLDDFEDDEDYWDSEIYDDDDDDIEAMSAEGGEDEDQRYFETHRKLTQNLHRIALKQEDQNKVEPLFVGEFFRSCAYKLSLAVVLLGCVLSLYLAYECIQGITQSNLKEHIAYQVINHHGQPSHLRSQIFTQHSYLDYPFQLYSFVDQQFANFLASGSPKNELFFSESFIPILFVPGSGQETEDIASVNHLDQKLQEIVQYEIGKQTRRGKQIHQIFIDYPLLEPCFF